MFQFGYKEPRIVPNGRVTIKILNEIINIYKDKRTNETLEELSLKYRIDKEKILILAEYYKSFSILKPTKEKAKQSTVDDSLDIFKNIKKPPTSSSVVDTK